MLLDQIDQLTVQIDRLSTRIEELIAAIPAAQGADADGTTGPSAGRAADAAVLPAIDRLDEITGIGRESAQAIIAEIGLDMGRFPTAGHLAEALADEMSCPLCRYPGARPRSHRGSARRRLQPCEVGLGVLPGGRRAGEQVVGLGQQQGVRTPLPLGLVTYRQPG